ncbi:hypothetical protein [Paenibacillus protaetiae]|uniref:Uncharacterized protein n=1 Tax=Paenibacillus protaetiae TaxID=2509456 RepID=A0A4P6EWW7_9BACL|nr:hypothetical protein [Paenibacillus protaetiae]QAY67534.1 hypothetical protein ET464_15200 [Paenibacillus protaetiae]
MIKNYHYIDESRLDMYFDQIPFKLPKEKKRKTTVGISLTGPKLDLTEETSAKAFNKYEKIDIFTAFLEKNNLIDSKRPKITYGNDSEIPFVLETFTARKVIFNKELLENIPQLQQLVIWISDPEDSDLSDEPWNFHGTFLYLTELWMDDGRYHTVWSGCSALQAIVNKIEGRSLLNTITNTVEPLGRRNFTHPVTKLSKLGAIALEKRKVTSLYQKRYITNEQCFTKNKKKFRVNDLLGYPIYIASEL